MAWLRDFNVRSWAYGGVVDRMDGLLSSCATEIVGFEEADSEADYCVIAKGFGVGQPQRHRVCNNINGKE